IRAIRARCRYYRYCAAVVCIISKRSCSFDVVETYFIILLMTLCFLLEPDDVRLVGGANPCAGTMELKHLGKWRPMYEFGWTLKDAAPICEYLDCGSAVSLQQTESPLKFRWMIKPDCVFSSLIMCLSSSSARNSCSPGKAVGLTCSEPDDVRLVGGANNCEGMMELRHLGEWRTVCAFSWTLKDAAFVCKHLDCGSAVSVDSRLEPLKRPAWWIKYDCVHIRSALKDCTQVNIHSSRNSSRLSPAIMKPLLHNAETFFE
uniref:SRCR domain-containing protein n=1 Tax=Neolamprologus brichardi TaxID=32507 RepID=A0A3Q4GFJ1_NEOBR